MRPCIVLSVSAFLAFVLSLSVALWWSTFHNDVSGGFAIGSYIIAVAAIPIAIAGYTHSRSCQCWLDRQHLIDRNTSPVELRNLDFRRLVASSRERIVEESQEPETSVLEQEQGLHLDISLGA